MSHIVTIKTQVRDPIAIAAACRRLYLPEPISGTAMLYSGEAAGMVVELAEWRYPVVFDTATGQVVFDNFEGRWGDPSQLDQLLQMYAVEKAKIEARRQGHGVYEQTLSDGSIKLTVQVGGVA